MFLIQAHQDDYRVQYPVVAYYFISIAKNNGTKEAKIEVDIQK